MLHTLAAPGRRLAGALAMLVAVLGLSGCGYNSFQNLDEQVQARRGPRCSTSTSAAPT